MADPAIDTDCRIKRVRKARIRSATAGMNHSTMRLQSARDSRCLFPQPRLCPSASPAISIYHQHLSIFNEPKGHPDKSPGLARLRPLPLQALALRRNNPRLRPLSRRGPAMRLRQISSRRPTVATTGPTSTSTSTSTSTLIRKLALSPATDPNFFNQCAARF